ncbi:hypothetical protein HG536_0A03440 [Torulaspora globosa]|uniref:Defect at low temperature protein 1 n=1 Tax=Torulaspora globosa TaxID=48254 RepID=A0A7G3ZAJ0_9SACH|nr:uncharacterized protein HG536_0A03440 [Torulaspora globosa]QLL30526.1 hypothetical protein HG536_0A03440 [Torulaspora globosa]
MKSYVVKWRLWIYRGSIAIAMVFLVGFSIVLPIDCIAQAAESFNNAWNTFIVVGALVAFAVACVIIIVARIIFYRSCKQHIPRWYLPFAPGDLPHRGSRKLVLTNMERSRELSTLFKRPKDPVIHAGMEPPIRCDDKAYEKLFPEYLNYASCIKVVADRLKYQGIFLNNADLKMGLDETFSDVVRNQFMDTEDKFQMENAQKLIDIYEMMRYSNEEVTRSQFVDFVSLAIYFVDISLTMDKKLPHLKQINTTSRLQFNVDDEDWERKISRTPTGYFNNESDKFDYVPYADSSSVLRRTFTGRSFIKPTSTSSHSGH